MIAFSRTAPMILSVSEPTIESLLRTDQAMVLVASIASSTSGSTPMNESMLLSGTHMPGPPAPTRSWASSVAGRAKKVIAGSKSAACCGECDQIT